MTHKMARSQQVGITHSYTDAQTPLTECFSLSTSTANSNMYLTSLHYGCAPMYATTLKAGSIHRNAGSTQNSMPSVVTSITTNRSSCINCGTADVTHYPPRQHIAQQLGNCRLPTMDTLHDYKAIRPNLCRLHQS